MKISPRQRDITILNKIVGYCDEIDEAVSRFNATFEILENDTLLKNAISMCILQIGELATHLTDDFKDFHPLIPWRKITDMRNIAAHHYGKFNNDILWETITTDISPLREYCQRCIDELKLQESAVSDTGSSPE
jgi:uncharacterized protein with HEPN domain